MTPIILDGTKPLWPNIGYYLNFFERNLEKICKLALDGDENADLIITAISYTDASMKNRLAVFQVAIERYIHDYHPNIAQIKGGYAKEATND